jgi:macrolide-specific efflux system membrane fusion protein
MFMNWKMDMFRMQANHPLSKYKPGICAAALVCVSLLASSCSFMPKEEQVLAPPLVEPEPIKHEVAEVIRGTIVKSVKGNASFTSSRKQELSFKDPDTPLKAFSVKAGDKVKRGDVLAELETGDLELELKVAEMELAKSRLHLSSLLKNQNDKYLIESAKLDVQKAEMNYKVTNTKLAKIELDKARLRLAELEANPDRALQIEKAKIDVAEKELELQYLRQKWENSRLVAPFDGEIVFVSDQSIGDQLEAYQPIITIADPQALSVMYTASDAEAVAEVEQGMPVTITVGGTKLEGKVVQSPRSLPAGLTDEQKSFYERTLVIQPKQIPDTIDIGTAARIEVMIQRKENALIIPRAALREFSGRTYVFLLDGKSKREVDVEVGILTPTEAEIVKGLKEKDRVILK